MLKIIGKAILCKFSFDAVAGAAHTGSIRASSLDHEAIDHTMEDQAVIEAFFDKADKVIHCIGGNFRIKLCFYHILVFHSNGYDWVCHIEISFISIVNP